MLKLADNPPIRPASIGSVADLDGDWWVAHTKARNEKAFAWDLHEKDIPWFIPMLQKVTFSGGRKRHGLVPLFTSYVFFNGTAVDRQTALSTKRLCQAIQVINRTQFVNELVALERAIESNMTLDTAPFAAVGKRCRVTAGPLEGIEGIVTKRDGVTRLFLQVSMLGAGSSLEISPDLLEPAE
jgi:transcription antitermination factor NusG